MRRLAQVGKRLSPGSVSALIDHHDQPKCLRLFHEITGYPLRLFIKIDTGYHRAGVIIESPRFMQIVSGILGNKYISAHTKLVGLYSHAGHSYGSSSATEAMDFLIEEIEKLREASNLIKSQYPVMAHQTLTLSVGATPSATSIQNLVHLGDGLNALPSRQIEAFNQCIRNVKANHDVLELHAGVYPFLDMQQLATQASPSASKISAAPELSTSDIAFTVLTEVASLYNERESREALIAAGSLALGREPCKSYQGWGIVSNWGMKSPYTNGRSGWQVGRISQEHGILNHEAGFHGNIAALSIGQRLRIFPNHACVAGAAFGWYLVVDSDLQEDRQDEIVDVWVRCRGW